MSRLDGYSLELVAPPAHPTIGFSYPSRSSLSRSASGASTSLKRKRSDDSMTVTITIAESKPDAPLVLPIIFPSVNRTDAPARPGSPTPTEIIEDVDEGSDVCMEKAKAAGVKVCDYAYVPLPKGPDPRAPEVWTQPLEALIMHDRYIRVAPSRAANFRLSGKTLHRLLELGWVTQEEAEFHWRDEDWRAVQAYRERPLGAYPFRIRAGAKKPTKAYREYLRQEKYVAMADDIPEKTIYVPEDEPGMDEGPARVSREFLQAAVAKLDRAFSTDDAPTPGANAPPTPPAHPPQAFASSSTPAVHVSKKRRVSGSTTPAATPQATPPASPSAAAPGRTPSRSASFTTGASSSRQATPPVASPPRRPARGRAGLTRTQTFDVIV